MKIRTLLFTLMLTCVSRALAQAPITEVVFTTEAATSLVAFYNDAENILTGDSQIAEGSAVTGNVALLDGILTLAGHIRGNVLVINGDVIVLPGAVVDGTLMIVGGTLRGAANLKAGAVQWYRERLKYELRDGRLMLMRADAAELAAGREFGFGRTDLLIAARGGYNRSEGLPVHIGPRVTLGRVNPTLLEGAFIFRTAAGFKFAENDFGYAIKAEQFIGGRRAARVGLRVGSETLPVESWGLSDRENSIAAFVLHRDYRDHYIREGWSAYLASGRPGLEFDWRVEVANQRFDSAPLRDPFSLTHNEEIWRRELAVPEVRLQLLRLAGRYDTRNIDRDPTSGWLVNANVEASLALQSGPADSFDPSYRFASVDVRRYARLSPYSRVSLRALVAGAITDDALPAFRQQSLGGVGSLPGYDLYEFDCGGHAAAETSTTSPYYGCDRLALLQLEYQSNLPFLSRITRGLGRDFGMLDNVKAVLFFDAGRTWNESATRGTRGAGLDDFVADAGFGVRFGALGAYWAVPLSARASGLNFVLRFGPRF